MIAGSFASFLALIIFILCNVVASNTRCNPRKLEALQPPVGGKLLPPHVWLEPRETFLGCSQQLNVYAADPPATTLGGRVGSFYDVRIPFIYFAVSYQDLDDNVWFHASTPGLFNRISWWLGDEFEVERCDMPSNATGGAFRVKQDWWEGSWWCLHNCERVFSLRKPTPPYDKVARITFDSALTWVFGKTRHQWSMQMTPSDDRSATLATAQSHVFPAPGTKKSHLFRLLSRWNVDIDEHGESAGSVPHWAAAFMAAMDEMEGQDEETDVDATTPPTRA